ncbi:NAD-dependent epimerase/dehydratase family protein [Agreia bicolorata]|uniref:NAD-dependent epimerase/dehydratase family protein n=1 Tax=Agreia bicolorata TaxID=110935 RepID=UPI000A49A516|nr:NAD(P)-dependent oxidoreductase [Agreia bicolorata]
MHAPHRILITGAAGKAGTGVRPLLRARGHELVLLDLTPIDAQPGERAITGSFTDEATLSDALNGVDAVVHFGGYSREHLWSNLLDINISGTNAVLDAARRAGVRHVLLASSTHAVGYHPIPSIPVHDLPPRPDSLYGVAKVAMEALGAVYADRYDMTVVSARIGTVEDRPRNLRSLSTWLSYSDLVRLIEATTALDLPGSHTVWAISANTRRWFDISNGQGIDYYPEDDAEFAAAEIFEPGAPGNGLIGAEFADPEHELGVPW